MAHLVKYDSIHGVLNKTVAFTDNSISIENKSYIFSPVLALVSKKFTPNSDASYSP
jgi:glyceraldehyde-3-phosphate dehydrogenase/erythrose-4-phosphate dehydrogenase